MKRLPVVVLCFLLLLGNTSPLLGDLKVPLIDISLVGDFLPIDYTVMVASESRTISAELEGLAGTVQWQCMVVRSKDVLSNVQVSLATSANGYKVNSTLYLVSYWYQMTRPRAGTKTSAPELTFTPELLKAASIKTLPNGSSNRISGYSSDLVQTRTISIAATAPAHLCVKIMLPEYKPTMASFDINLTLEHKGISVGSANIIANVVGPSPSSTKSTRIVYYHGSLNPVSPGYLSELNAKKQLEDINDHGFSGVTIAGSDKGYMLRLAKLAISVGVGNQIIFAVVGGADLPIAEMARALKGLGAEVYIMTSNEPNNTEKLNKHTARLNKYRDIGVKTYVPIAQKFLNTLEVESMPDWVNISYRSAVPKLQSKMWNVGVKTIYWQSYMEMPVLNRYLSGLALCGSNYDGIFPYAYQHRFIDDQPYSTDIRHMGNPVKTLELPHAVRKYYYSVYPGAQESVTTLQWEAFRVGLDDLELCQTLKEYSVELIESGNWVRARAITIRLSRMLDKLNSQRYRANDLNAYKAYRDELAESLDNIVGWMLSVLTIANK